MTFELFYWWLGCALLSWILIEVSYCTGTVSPKPDSFIECAWSDVQVMYGLSIVPAANLILCVALSAFFVARGVISFGKFATNKLKERNPT